MRIGVFGGSFDPVHRGHIALARLAQRQYRLDTIYFVPAKQPPHKLDRPLAPVCHRLKMLQTVMTDRWHISHFELNATGTTYTWQTLVYFRTRFARAELFFILGGDSLDELSTWQHPERIAQMCAIIAGPRAGIHPGIPTAFAGKVQLVTGNIPAVSSTDIRRKKAEHRGIATLVPPAVNDYIAHHHLYEHIE